MFMKFIGKVIMVKIVIIGLLIYLICIFGVSKFLGRGFCGIFFLFDLLQFLDIFIFFFSFLNLNLFVVGFFVVVLIVFLELMGVFKFLYDDFRFGIQDDVFKFEMKYGFFRFNLED